jgi:hypothetical protein
VSKVLRSARFRAGTAGFLLSLAALLPQAFNVAAVPERFLLSPDGDQAGWTLDGPLNGWSPDEDEYGWSAAYYGSRAARLDLSPGAGGSDPGWSPNTYWAVTQPMGTRFLFAAALGISGAEAPARRPALQQAAPREWLADTETMLAPSTRLVLRIAAVVCAALGLALVAWRLSWWGLAAAGLFLALPNVRSDLALAWAEGPLLLGIGICIAGYGRRWFGAALGLAASFKLTALGLWPLLFAPGAGHGRRPVLRAAISALAVWTLLDPPSWFAGGPAFLGAMLRVRMLNELAQNESFGLYAPARYQWPAQLLVLVGLALLARWIRAEFRPPQPRRSRRLFSPG